MVYSGRNWCRPWLATGVGDIWAPHSSRQDQGPWWVHIPGPSWATGFGVIFGDRQQGLQIWSAVSVHIYAASTLWDGLTQQCMHSTYGSGLSDSDIASHCLLGWEKHFVLLLSCVKLKVRLFHLETACPPKSVCLVLERWKEPQLGLNEWLGNVDK